MSREWDVQHLANAADAYKQLALLICEDTRVTKALLVCVGPEDVDPVARALVQVSEVMGRGALLVRVVIEGEFERNASVATIFRLKSLASRTLSNYVRKTGHLYLSLVLGDLLPRLVGADLAHPIEIDPAKLGDVPEGARDGLLNTNREKLMAVAQAIFDRITSKSMIEVMPRGFRAACFFIASCCDRRSHQFTPEDKCNLVGGFMFLRFFNPSLITPEANDLLPPGQVPTPTTRRNLILITKLLQNLSNNIQFGKKEQFMVPMNRFLKRNAPAMRAYLEELPLDPLRREGREAWGDLEVLAPAQLPLTLRDFEIKDFVVLHRVFAKHADTLRQHCGAAGGGGDSKRGGVDMDTLLRGLGESPKHADSPGAPGKALKLLGHATSVSFDTRIGVSVVPSSAPSPPSSPAGPVPAAWDLAQFAFLSGHSVSGASVLYLVVRRFFYEWLARREQLLSYLGSLLHGAVRGKLSARATSARLRKVKSAEGGLLGRHSAKEKGESEGEGKGEGGGEASVDVVVDLSWAGLPDDLLHKFVIDIKGLHQQLPSAWLERVGRVYVVHPNRLYFVAMHTLNPVLPSQMLIKLEEIYDWKMLRRCLEQVHLPHDTRLFVPGGFNANRITKSAFAHSHAARVIKVTEHSVLVINPKTNQVRHDHPLPDLLHIATSDIVISLQFQRAGGKSVGYAFELGSLEEVDTLANLLLQACVEYRQQPDLPWEFTVSKRNTRGRHQQRTATLGGDCLLNINRKYVRGVIPFMGLNEVFFRGCVVHLRFKGVHEQTERGERLLTARSPLEAQHLTTQVQLGIKRERERIQQSLLKLSSQMNSASFTSFLLAFRFAKKWLKVARAKIAEKNKMKLFHKQRALMVKKIEGQLYSDPPAEGEELLPEEQLVEEDDEDDQAPMPGIAPSKPSLSAPVANPRRNLRESQLQAVNSVNVVAGDESDSDQQSDKENSSEEESAPSVLRKVQSAANRASQAFVRFTLGRSNRSSKGSSGGLEVPTHKEDMQEAEEALRNSANDDVWVEYMADDGRPYFHNPVSGHTTWTSHDNLLVPKTPKGDAR